MVIVTIASKLALILRKLTLLLYTIMLIEHIRCYANQKDNPESEWLILLKPQTLPENYGNLFRKSTGQESSA